MAVQAEETGFDVVLQGDHIGPEYAPLPALAAMATATTTIRLGTLVLNADVRNPVQLAWEALSLDLLSDGRFELGIGAGHTPQEYEAMGIELRSAAQRKRRLMECVEVLRRLLDGQTVDYDGEFFRIRNAHVGHPVQERLPLLVGGNGSALLRHAGAHCEIIGLQGLGRTLEDGHRHDVRWSTDHLERQIEQVRSGAGDRFEGIELNALVQTVDVTDDPEAAIRAICERVDGLTREDANAIPYLMIGTVNEIVEKLHRCRERWGISYFVVRDLDAFAPVVRAVRAEESEQVSTSRP